MAEIKRVSPAEAKGLLDEGWVYVDVRTVQEFDAEHPAGAYNVPLLHGGPGGMAQNPDFVEVMTACFPLDGRIVLGCRAGQRSLHAARLLLQNGFTHVVDQRAGFEAARDPFGRLLETGWKGAGLPTETGAGGERSWRTLAARK